MRSGKVGKRDAEFALVEALEEISSDGALWFELVAGGTAGGCASAVGAYIASRCLMEAETGNAFDAKGRFAPVPCTQKGPVDPVAARVLARVRRVLRDALRGSAEYVLCYHVEGDPGWYMAWSDHYDAASAAEAVVRHLQSDMPWL